MAYSVMVLYEMMKKPDDDDGENLLPYSHIGTKTETSPRRPRCLGLYPSLDALETPLGGQFCV